MGKKNEPPEQPLLAILVTLNEAVVLGAAVTTYQRQANRYPEQRKARQQTLKLLERFQRRLVQQLGQDPPDTVETEIQKFLAKRKFL